MYIIGLTGNIATGKSTVGAMLARLGARYVDADELAHQAISRGGPAFQAVLDEFGGEIVGADGEVDRPALARIVFANPERLRCLEEIVHPAVSVLVAGQLAAATEPVVVLDAIKLIESGMAAMCDAVWVVVCPREQQIARLMRTRGMTRNEAIFRIDAQPPQEEKAWRADVVIDNRGSLARTRRQVLAAWRQIPGAGCDSEQTGAA